MYQKSHSYDVWFLRYRVRQAEIFVISGYFLPFQPPDNQENQNFKIEKNTWRYHNFTHLHHKWQSYDVCMVPKIWSPTDNIFCHSEPLFALLPLFAPPPPGWTQNMKILEKWITHLKILSFYKGVPQMTVIWWWCMAPEIWSATDRIFCHSGPFFALLMPYGPKKSKF